MEEKQSDTVFPLVCLLFPSATRAITNYLFKMFFILMKQTEMHNPLQRSTSHLFLMFIIDFQTIHAFAAYETPLECYSLGHEIKAWKQNYLEREKHWL